MMGGVIMSIPSPDISQFALGPLTIRFYALCLMTGMVVAWWLGRRRWVARGGLADTFEALALVAIPSGIVGARIYHVVTHWEVPSARLTSVGARARGSPPSRTPWLPV